MPLPSRFCLPLATAALAIAATAFTPATAGAAVDGAAVRAYTDHVASAWSVHQQADGTIRDPLQPSSRGISYGTVMLGDAMLGAAAGGGDAAVGDRAASLIRASMVLGAPADPFNLLAIAALARRGDTEYGSVESWHAMRADLRAWAGQIARYPWQGSDGHCFTTPGCYSNFQLVWSAGAAELLGAGVDGAPGSLAADRPRVEQEIRTTVNDLAVHAAGRTARGVGAPARVLSDPPQNPLAYHLFSTYMLERVHSALPSVFGPAGLKLRAEAGRYALALMAPDGDLAYAGRSDQESWVLAAAAALGARRAAEGGPDAPRWRSFADRALERLWREHSVLADGTIPIVPGLRARWEDGMLDSYAQMAQYNGLTVWLLADAAAHWPAVDAPRAPLPADRNLLVDDLGGTGLVWGRHGDVWWAVSGRRTAPGPRYDQGVVAVKSLAHGKPLDLVAARPREGRPTGAWLLETPKGRARFVARKASGSGARATLAGDWRLKSGRTWRRASWTISSRKGGMVAATALRRHERLGAAVWAHPGDRSPLTATGSASTGRCRASASGTACPYVTRWSKPGRAALELAPLKRVAPPSV